MNYKYSFWKNPIKWYIYRKSISLWDQIVADKKLYDRWMKLTNDQLTNLYLDPDGQIDSQGREYKVIVEGWEFIPGTTMVKLTDIEHKEFLINIVYGIGDTDNPFKNSINKII